MKWIDFKSRSAVNILAFATVLSNSKEQYGVVRHSFLTPFLIGLEHITIDYYPNDGQDLVVIEDFQFDNWELICNHIANMLLVKIVTFNPFFGSTQNTNLNDLLDEKMVLLHLFPHRNQQLDLMIVDQVVKLFANRGVNSISTISGGSMLLPCIRGTKDLRGVISAQVLYTIREKIGLIITSEKDYIILGEILGIPTFMLSHESNLMIDNTSVVDANQIFNYINLKRNQNYEQRTNN